MAKPLIKPNNRNFGIEVEMSTDIRIVEDALKKSKLMPKNSKYNTSFGKCDTDGKKFFLMVDGSTETELVTPKMQLKSDVYFRFKKIIKFLYKSGFKITNNDGLHIHVDVADVNPDQVLTAWLYIENKIKTVFPKHRRKFTRYGYTNPYMKKHSKSPLFNTLCKIKKNSSETDHHAACSFFSYKKNKDIEIRFMEGTLDIQSIDMWVKFCIAFVEFAKKINTIEYLQKTAFDRKLSFDFLCAEMKIHNSSLIYWLKSRENKFKLK